jgi:hypothetical protein
MTDNGGRQAATTGLRTEIIGAIADLAIAARAGTLLKAYQREWSWVDKQNYEDAVDADEFNEAFHGIEREFDKLAQILAQGAGGLPAPDWDSDWITLSDDKRWTLITHNLNSTDLLVDVKMEVSTDTKTSLINQYHGDFDELDISVQWQHGKRLFEDDPAGYEVAEFSCQYILPNPNQILIGGQQDIPDGGLIVRALVWKW